MLRTILRSFIIFTLVSPNTSIASEKLSLPVIIDSHYLVKSVLSMCLVLLLIWVVAKILKPLADKHKGNAGPLKVLASISIGHREKIVIVMAGETQYLLGLSASGIEKIDKFDKPLIDTESPKNTFKNQLAKLTGEKRK